MNHQLGAGVDGLEKYLGQWVGTGTMGKIVLINAMHLALEPRVRAEIADIGGMPDYLTGDYLLVVVRKSDRGKLILRLPDDDLMSWKITGDLKISEENLALLHLFLG